MKTRLQLARGYVAGSLTALEKVVAEQNPIVMSEVKQLMEPKQETGEYKQRKRGTHARSETP